MRLILTFTLLILAFGTTAAQDSRPDCPAISVTGPAGIVQPGEEASFIANTDEAGKKYHLNYQWSTSIGEIVSGQGTSSIKVTWPAGVSTITITVEIKGLPNGCPATASAMESWCAPPVPISIDEFGRLSNNSIKAKLDNLFVDLSNNPGSQGYIINYGNVKEISIRERLIVRSVSFRNFDRSRITLVRGGLHESGKVYTRLWRVPPGANDPTP